MSKGSVLSPLLFIIVMEVLSRHFQTACPWELLYADELVITAETLHELLEKFRVCKTNLETKGLCVNVGETKIMVVQTMPLNQFRQVNFLVVCAIKVLDPTL